MSGYVKSNYYTIPYHSDYGINTNGQVINKQTNEKIQPEIKDGHLFVSVDNELLPVAQIIVSTFIGPLPGKIYFKDDNPLNCRTDNISYLLNIEWENIDSPNSDVIINGQRFKLAAHYNSRYYLSEYGILYDRNYGIRPHSFSKREYWSVVITEGWDNRNKRMISRWTYETWVGEIPYGYEIDHLDGHHWNNHISNFEPVTPEENIRRSYDVTHARKRVWTKDQVRRVCEMMSQDFSISEILTNLNMNKDDYLKMSRLIQDIRSKRYHKEISKDYDIENYHSISENTNEGNRSLSLTDVKHILELSKSGMSNNDIARELNTTHSVVYGIVSGRSYKTYLKQIESELI